MKIIKENRNKVLTNWKMDVNINTSKEKKKKQKNNK